MATATKKRKTSANFRIDAHILKQARLLCEEMDLSLSLIVGQALRKFVQEKTLNISYYPDEYMTSVSHKDAENLESLSSFNSFYDSL